MISISTLREGEKLQTELCKKQETGLWGGERDLMPMSGKKQ